MMQTTNGIMYRTWGPRETPKAVFLLVHGLGAHSGRWEFFGEFFASRGYVSYAIELKGYGMTPGVRGYVDSFETYYRDIAALAETAGKEHPGKKIYLVGESMGGLIAYLHASSSDARWDGLVCLSPAFKSRLPLGWATYAAIFMSFYLTPTRQFRMPFTSAMCTRDAAYRAVMDMSLAENRLASARMLGLILFGQMKARGAGRRCRVPLFFLLAGDDAIVDPAAAAEIFDRSRCPQKEIVRYPEMHHSLSVELGREKVFGDILRWVEGMRAQGGA